MAASPGFSMVRLDEKIEVTCSLCRRRTDADLEWARSTIGSYKHPDAKVRDALIGHLERHLEAA